MELLPRRPFLGLSVRAEARGLRVTRVVPGSSAEGAGLLLGDLLTEVAGAPLREVGALVEALRRGATNIGWEREGLRAEATVEPVPFPPEEIPGAEVRYEHVVVRGARWRTILTRPTRPGPHPGLLFLAGIGWSSLDFAGREGLPLARFFATLAKDVVTLRLERGALGDGEGPVGSALDFEMEQEGYRAAMTRLAAETPYTILFGHSLGGVHAPLLLGATRPRADGLVVYGTSPERWSTCLANSARRQMHLRGRSGEADAQAEAARAFETAELRTRPPAFHAQLEALELEAAWRNVPCPALVLIGEHDWVVSEEEQRRITALAPRGEALVVPGIDHAFTRHASAGESLARYGEGTPADEVAEETRRWVLARFLEAREALTPRSE